MRMESTVSEPSVSVTAAEISIDAVPSSVTKTSLTLTIASSATPSTSIVNVPEPSDQTCPSKALNVSEVSPDQSASGSNVSLPASTSFALISSPASTACPFSVSAPLPGSESMRYVSGVSPVSTSMALMLTVAVVSSLTVIVVFCGMGGSLTGSMCTSSVAAPTAVSPLSASVEVALKVSVKSVSWFAPGVMDRVFRLSAVMSAVPFHAVTVLTPSVNTVPVGAPVTSSFVIDSEPSVSVSSMPTSSGIGVSSTPEAFTVVTVGASASPTTTIDCTPVSDHA